MYDATPKKWWFQELIGDGLSWQYGAKIDVDGSRGIKQGSGYAAVGYKDSKGPHIRLYYEDRFNHVNEMQYDLNGPWKECEFGE